MPSLTDVAARAGVSVATASRVLGDSTHPVAEPTRQRVIEAAAALDFEPNLLARGLVRQRTQTVGVLVHDVMDPYFNEIARGIEDAAYAHGYAAFICNSDRDPAKELHYLRKLRAMQVDAIIFTASGINDRNHQREAQRQVDQVEEAGGIIVRLAPHPSRKPELAYSNSVGFRLAVEHLHKLGHRAIGFITGPASLATSAERLHAFRRAIRRQHLDPSLTCILAGDFTQHGGELAAAQFLAAGAPTTAIVAANDQLAIGFMRALRAAGLSVPEDVSVVGFDDVSSCVLVEPPLTTVRVPLHELGSEGMLLALKVLAGEPRPSPRNLPLNLVIRASSGPPPSRRLPLVRASREKEERS